jgi:hypothetical protein
MPLATIPVYASGDTIEASWANDLRGNFLTLDARTGGDPGAAGRVAVSTSSAAAAWQVLAESNQLTAAKVNQVAPQYTSFLAALAGNSGFFFIPAASTDGPMTGVDWHVLQVRWPNAGFDYRLDIACAFLDTNELYVRTVANGVAGTWRKLWHAGNAGVGPFLPLVGGTLSGELTMGNGIGVSLGGNAGVSRGRLYDAQGVSTIVLTHNNELRVYNNALTQLMATINATLATFLGGIAATTGAFTGALSAASAAITGALTAASATVTGLLKGQTLESTVATGTAPIVVASTTKVTNLNADLLDGLTSGHSSGNIPISDGTVNTNLNADLLDGLDWFTPVHVAGAAGSNPIANAFATIVGMTYTTTRSGRYLVAIRLAGTVTGATFSGRDQWRARVHRTGSGTVDSAELHPTYEYFGIGSTDFFVQGSVVITAISGDVLAVQAIDTASAISNSSIDGATSWADFIWIGL